MTTTPTLWSSEVTFSNDPLAVGPQVLALADDTFILGWQNGSDIFGRHLDASGNFTSGDFLSSLSSSSTNELLTPKFIQQSDGSVVVEYGLLSGQTSTSFDDDVQWHIVRSDYSPDANTFPIEDSSTDEIFADAAATADTGGSAVVFTESAPGTGGETLTVLRFVNSAGVQISSQIVVGSHLPGQSQFAPSIAADPGDGSVVVAYENVDATDTHSIRLHIYTAFGVNLGADNGEVTVSTTGFAVLPDVAVLHDGSFVVTWQQNGDGIYYREYGLGGIAIDAAPRFLSGTGNESLLPKIAALKDGGFIIAWADNNGTHETNGSLDFNVALQRFDASGNAVGEPVVIANPGDQGFNSLDALNLTTLADGRVVVAFETETGDSTNVFKMDYVILDPRDTTINGSGQDDTIVGRVDGSAIFGFDGSDHLIGMTSADNLNGGTGDDTLSGGLGKDTLVGGGGADIFNFDLPKESKGPSHDVIMDFRHAERDRIDLRDIDANKKKVGDQAFHLTGHQGLNGFTRHPGELHLIKHGGVITVEGDVNGDGRADFQIAVHDTHKLMAGDFDL